MDLSSKETSSFNEVNIMKKRYSIGLLLVMSTMLISCGGEASTSSSTSTSTSPSTPSTPTPSIDTGKTGNTSSSKEEDVIGVKGQEGALYASVDLMGSKMIDLAAPFDLSYRTVNGKFGSGENADAQIVVKDATAKHKEKDGTDASASPLHALNSVFSLLPLVSSMGIGGIDLSSIPYISDLQMNAANFYNDEFDGSNSYGQMNIDYKDGQNVYYYAEVTPKDETGALKNDEKTLREYAETELTLPEIPSTSNLADTLKAFIDIAFGEDGMLNKGFDMSILEALLPSFNLEDNAIAKALSVLATGLEGSIEGEDDKTTGNHKTIITLGLNDTGITDANVYMNDLTGGMATLSNISLSLEFTKVANADVSTFTGFDVTVGVMALGSLPVGIDLALKLDPTTKDLKADALDEMDEGALKTQASYQKYKALKNKVDEYYDFSVDASYGVDAEDIIKSKGKNIELTSAYGEKIAKVGAEVEALDTYTKGLFNPETYDFVKPANGTSSSKVYVGLAYDKGIELLNKSKTYADSFNQADLDGLTIAGMLADETEVFGEDGFNVVTLSYFKNYESNYTEAEKAKLDALMTKYASLYDEYVNVIVEDTKEESLYDSFDKIGKIIDKDCTIFDDCFTTYPQYSMFYGDNKTSIDASIAKALEVNTKLRNKIAELAGSITSYDDLAVVSSTMSKAMQLSKNVFAIDENGAVKDSDYDAFKAKLIADNVDKYDGLMEAKAKEDVAALKPEAQKVTSKEEALLVITKINNAKSKVENTYKNWHPSTSMFGGDNELPENIASIYDSLITSIQNIWIK